jgi:peptide/nickel transport system substrate-binding protein
MDFDHERLDRFRRGHGPLTEHVIDEFVEGRLSRRGFVQRAALFGLALPTVGGILSACGTPDSPSGQGGTGRSGATIKAGCIAPTGDPNPLLVIDIGGIQLLNQVGEGLVFFDDDNVPRPWLATSWTANRDGTVWTFKIRQGVKFNDGTPMTVDDVVYTYRSHADPKNSGTALSLFAGLLDPDGVVKVDDETIAFNLKAPYGAFPAVVSQYNYSTIVVPKGTDFTKWSGDFIGTGPFKMKTFNQTSGATFDRNPHYWGESAAPNAVEIAFYQDEQPMVAALQAKTLDCIGQFTVSNSPQLLGDRFTVVSVRGSAHRALSLRNDLPQFANKYVRQAIALTLDRDAIISGLFKGHATAGNDSPFAPSFPMTDTTVPQRKQDLTRAKELLAQGGMARGFAITLYTQQLQELPQLAQIIKDSAAKIGVDITLDIQTIAGYYGDAEFGKSNWLDGAMSLVDYGARPVPNLFLQAPLQSTDPKTGQGSWNAAHFSNATYDSLSRQYVAAVDIAEQRRLATRIQTLLLDETPVVYPYFYDYLAASQKNVFGIQPQAGQQLYLNKVTKS